MSHCRNSHADGVRTSRDERPSRVKPTATRRDVGCASGAVRRAGAARNRAERLTGGDRHPLAIENCDGGPPSWVPDDSSGRKRSRCAHWIVARVGDAVNVRRRDNSDQRNSPESKRQEMRHLRPGELRGPGRAIKAGEHLRAASAPLTSVATARSR